MKLINNEFYDRYGDRWYTDSKDPVAILRAEAKTKNPWVQDQITAHFRDRTPKKIIDVGCGAGFLSNYLSQQGHTVTGVDLSAESLKTAAKYDASKAVNYVCGNAYQLPFAAGEFDAVTCMDFLEHVEEPAAVIAECARVLRPGGLFIFHTFNRNWIAGLVVIKLIEWIVPNTPKNMHVLRLFITPQEFRAYCARVQLEVNHMSGLKPVISSIPLSAFFKRVVPTGMRFELTRSLVISYIGTALKNQS